MISDLYFRGGVLDYAHQPSTLWDLNLHEMEYEMEDEMPESESAYHKRSHKRSTSRLNSVSL